MKATTVPAAEFTQHFSHYTQMVQNEAIAVSNQGEIAGYFLGAEEYEAFRRFKSYRRSFTTTELKYQRIDAIEATRMDPRHAHLNALLDE